MTREPATGPLWVVTLLMSGLLIVGSLVSMTHRTAIVFGIMGGIALPFVSLLHSADC